MTEKKKNMSQDPPKEFEELEKQLDDCRKLKEEYLNSWKRERADFLNYKKEEAERMNGIIAFLDGSFALKIIPILDNLDIAEQKLSDELKADESVKGILQIKKQICELLKSLKVTEIETNGKKFDPNFHEAVAEESKESIEPGMVMEEIKKGYLLDGKVLRPAIVKVSK